MSGGQAKWKTYRTRIVSTANQVNLKFDEAIKSLEDGLVRSISGIF
ncbi:complement resistance protein TraT [Bathymodiolus thermophilus thioautotrophic gill symbiont]|nr:complement resistance protein TraT [Bathymodiolus thermophilus thioautotrophic gill symbiont]